MRAAGALARATPTLLDVARIAGVSVATASRALNGHPGVLADKVQRIHAAALELGYVADATARTVSGGTSSTVAVALVDSADTVSIQLIRGAVSAAEAHDLSVLVALIDRGRPDQGMIIRRLRRHRPRAIVVFGDHELVDPEVAVELDHYRRQGGHVETSVLPDCQDADGGTFDHCEAQLIGKDVMIRAVQLTGRPTCAQQIRMWSERSP